VKKVIHLSGLNGIRAIAAMAVLFGHTTLNLDTFGLNSYIFGVKTDGHVATTTLANYGVTMFFALSGFLITYLLLEEKKEKPISIRNFYVRRILRIWPLYFGYMLLAILTSWRYDMEYEKTDLLFYVFLAANFAMVFNHAITLLGHYWSLGVEEQFYSFWPWVIKRSADVFRSTAVLCTSLIVLKVVLRVMDIQVNDGAVSWPYAFLEATRIHCMLIGALGAILLFRQHELFQRLATHVVAQVSAWVVILLVAVNRFHVISVLDNELIAVVTVVIITGQVRRKNRLVNLDHYLLDRVGRISYGIYMIHPLLLFYLAKIISLSDTHSVVNYLFVYATVFSTTILAAYLSYEFFEKRFLAIKARYSVVKSVDAEDALSGKGAGDPATGRSGA
jgi:peptidoglycan/LPS O-acetylase OafA/YrhL